MLVAAGSDTRTGPAELLAQSMFRAAAQGRGPLIVDMLLKAGTDFNTGSTTRRLNEKAALYELAENSGADIQMVLLTSGADINAPVGPRCGRTKLQAATQHGNENMAKPLLKETPNTKPAPAETSGRTGLLAPAKEGNSDIVGLLFQ